VVPAAKKSMISSYALVIKVVGGMGCSLQHGFLVQY
jgi:hypothetical protein